MPRNGGNADVRWFDIDPCYVFHPMNAYAENGVVTLDVARYEQLLFMDPKAARDPGWRDKNVARLHRCDDRPRHGRRRARRRSTTATASSRASTSAGSAGSTASATWRSRAPRAVRRACPVWTSVRKFDLERGTSGDPALRRRQRRRRAALRRRGTTDAEEDDGYVLVLSYDQARNASAFFVLDARDLTGEPLAEIRVPHRVPYGFHGNWVPAA